MKSAFVREMKRRGIKNPFELTEFDQWVNDATREDINILAEKHLIFGLKLWDFVIIDRNDLKDICNFGVSFIFRSKDRSKILNIIKSYKNHKKRFSGFNMMKTQQAVENLIKLAIYSCVWV